MDDELVLGPDVDKTDVASPKIDCASLMHLCKARCCRLSVGLDTRDLEDGLRWEAQRPYELERRREDGYCVYCHKDTFHCDVYAKRPAICRSYDCRKDPFVWEDFAAKQPAAWVEDVDLPPPLVHIRKR